MKKVLIITHLLRASPRIPGLAKYLPEFGWQPIVLTPPIGERADTKLKVMETGYRESLHFWKRLFRIDPHQDERMQLKQRLGMGSQKSLADFLLTRVGEIVNYPDSDKGWRTFAIKTGDSMLREEGIDAILSSSSPVTAHLIASELKRRHQTPWIADLRDLWSQNHNYYYSRLRRWFDRRLELKVLSGADALVTVSQPWADKLGTLHGRNVVHSITNGFDPETMNEPPARLTQKFTLTHTGSIYAGKQSPSKLFAALQKLILAGTMDPASIEVRFYGPRLDWLDRESEKYGLMAVVKQFGVVPQASAIEKQRESQVLLAIGWEKGEGLVGIQGKLFEYLAAQRPILSMMGHGNYLAEKLLAETKAGIHAPTEDDIKNSLEGLYREYKSQGNVSYRGDIREIERYSYRAMAHRFSDILSQLTVTA